MEHSPNDDFTPAELDVAYAPVVAGLRRGQREALLHYQAGGHRVINGFLRGGNVGDVDPDVVEDMIVTIESAMDPVPRAGAVYRGVDDIDVIRDSDTFLALLSTSILEDVAQSHADAPRPGVVRILVPSGQRALWLPPLDPSAADEMELLLPSGLHYAIRSERVRGGIVTVEVALG